MPAKPVEMRALRASGRSFRSKLPSAVFPAPGRLPHWYLRDITEWKQSESSLRAIVETTPECVKVIGRDGTVLL